MVRGSMVALITPMQSNGSIDYKSLQHLVEWHIEAKTKALIVVGTTGEAATLTPNEQQDVITRVVMQVAGRIPVIAGTGTNCTQTTIERTLAAQAAGVDGLLIVTPYYNKPTQSGLHAHYQLIAEKTNLPIILYNVPGRTACDLLPETVEKLASIENIIGIKEATGKVERCEDILKRCGTEFKVYSGDDATALDLMVAGAEGVISVTANVSPHKMNAMCEAILSGDKVKAQQLNDELMPLHTKLFVEANPIPTKWLLNKMGLIPEGIRLPLLPLDEKFHQELMSALESACVKQ